MHYSRKITFILYIIFSVANVSGKLKRTNIDVEILSNKISLPTEDEIAIQRQNVASTGESDYLDCAKVGEFVSKSIKYSLLLR